MKVKKSESQYNNSTISNNLNEFLVENEIITLLFVVFQRL